MKSDRVNLVAPASPVQRARYSTNWDRKREKLTRLGNSKVRLKIISVTSWLQRHWVFLWIGIDTQEMTGNYVYRHEMMKMVGGGFWGPPPPPPCNSNVCSLYAYNFIYAMHSEYRTEKATFNAWLRTKKMKTIELQVQIFRAFTGCHRKHFIDKGIEFLPQAQIF